MSDETTSVADESQAEESATQGEDVATIKRRLAGKDQALTKAQQERDRLAAEADELRRWKAERENADLSEVEKLQKRLKELESRAEAAQAEARKNALARKFPAFAELIDQIDGLDFNSEEAAQTIEEFISKRSKAASEGTETEARIDPNNPRKNQPAKGTAKMTTEQLLEQIGNVDPSYLMGSR